ncbi:MAG: GGDEF domain-containing phosphodiesterase [Halioglobus sp.]
MPQTRENVIGIVELTDEYDASDQRAAEAFNGLRDAFFTRLQGWVRAKDECRKMNHNRVCVVLRDIGGEGELLLAASKLQRLFKEPHHHLGANLHFSVRAGFSLFSSANDDVNLAMRQAGIALNQARYSPQLYEVYSPQRTRNLHAETALLHKMEDALENGEFQLYYQPQMHAGYNTLLGAEALLRWHTRDNEVLTPAAFIDVAEKNDIIKPITWWVIKSAVARLARWPEALGIAVNVPPSLLLQDDIQSVVHDALDIYGVTPSRLNLEVTERIMVDNQDFMLRQLHALRDVGVKISIDDFGTGFSSLSYFRDLPVDEIKIDQSFVRAMLRSEKDHAIVKAVIDLAHNFSLKVVAEGVETRETAERLTQMRCDILQGYVFDRPMPVEAFERQYRL